MKPIAIFRFCPGEGAGHFDAFLRARKIPSTLFRLDAGDTVPTRLDDYAGFVFMGGPMSVNDDIAWIEPTLALIRAAIAREQPCMGHCLGGQLIAKALGGAVTKNPVKEIGWNPLAVDNNAIARAWLGDDLVEQRDVKVFQWHGETFSIPPGATRILSGDVCANQAYVVGNSLGMQCHVEMTAAMIAAWCRDWESEHANPELPSIQTPEEILAEMSVSLRQLNEIADRLYEKWLEGCRFDAASHH